MKTRVLSLNLPAAMVCLACLTASAAEIHVTPDSPGIQAAIESAADGDQIIVLPGVYQEHINFLGKAITVRSNDPDNPDIVAATIIDGTGTGRCVTFENDEGPESVLAGLTITNGNAQGTQEDRHGGGMYCYEASPTISSNLIADNTAKLYGGGLYCVLGAPQVIGNVFSSNSALSGGGAYCRQSSLFIADNTFEGNSGGGLVCLLSSAQIFDNLFEGNSGRYGGGIYFRSDDQPLKLCGNLITGNSASLGAGAMIVSLDLTEVFLSGNVVTGNTASNLGGGYWLDATCFVVGDVIAGNSAHINGGIGMQSSLALFSNNTVILNSTWSGAAFACFSSTVRMLNNIILGNFSRYDESYQILMHGGLDPSFLFAANNIIELGREGVSILGDSTLTWASGNLDLPPLFVDPGHWDDNGTPHDYDDDFFVMGDYRLLPGSPCIDRGLNNIDDPATEAIEELPETELGGLPRIIDGDGNGTLVVDIGAYEYLPGDVNYDGKTNVLDLLHVRNNLGRDPSSDPAARRADVNADGNVDIMDLIAVRNQIGAW